MKLITLSILIGGAALAPSALLAQFAGPQPVAFDTGTTSTDGWYTLTASEYPDYPGFPGSSPWPSGMAPQTGASTAILDKVSNGVGGGPFPSGSGIYNGGFSNDPNLDGGTLAVNESSPVTGLSTIVFQISIGESSGYDFFDNGGDIQSPELTISYGSSQSITLSPDFTELMQAYNNGTFTPPGGEPQDLFINLYGYQWDVSTYSNITDLSIQWTGVQHGVTYGLQLDQSSVDYGSTNMIPTVVPEPAEWASIVGFVTLGLVMLRRRRKSAQ